MQILDLSFFPLAAKETQKMDLNAEFSQYLWVEADVWDGSRLIERLVPEGTGLVEVAPQL